MNENNIQNEKEITEAPIEETEQYEESYSIYEFFKNDTSFLIAVASALIAIAAAFLKMCSSIYQNGYLKYWNINPKFADNVSSYWFETIAFSFLFFVTTVFSSLVISSNLPVYLNKIEVSLSVIIWAFKGKKKTKEMKREIKCQKKRLKKIEKSKKGNNLKKEIKDLKKQIKNTEKENSILNEEWIALIKSMHKINKNIICEICIYTMLIGLVFIVTGFPVIFQDNLNSNLSIAAIGLCYAIIIIAFVILSIIVIFIRALRKKTLSYNKYSVEDIKNILLKKPSLKHIFSSKSDRHLSNKTIKLASILIIIYVLCFLLSIIMFNGSKAKNQKEFQIINNNSITYAILHVDDSNVIAERIEINDKNAVIYVNEQIIIPKEEIEMKVYTFKNVTRDNT